MIRSLTTAFAALVILGAASAAHADDLSIDQAADAMRHHGPVVNQPLVTKNVGLTKNVKTRPSIDFAGQSFGGGY